MSVDSSIAMVRPFWEGDYEKAFHRLVIAQMERFYCTTCEDRSRWLCQAVAHNQHDETPNTWTGSRKLRNDPKVICRATSVA